MIRSLEIGFQLDQLWHALRGEMETTKRPALVALARVLRDADIPYAIIGGIARQVHEADPRTTLDIDLAVARLDAIPRAELQAAGFQYRGASRTRTTGSGPLGCLSSSQTIRPWPPRWSGQSRSTWTGYRFA